MIDPEFFNDEVYAIYTATKRLAGPEIQKEVVRLSGELMFSQIKEKLQLSKTDPISLVKTLIKYLEKVGYFSKGEVEVVSDKEVLVHMHGAACHDAAVKFKNEGTHPHHFCTTLIFAALKDMFNIKVDLTHLDLGQQKPPYHTVEKWTLTKIKEG